MVLKPEIGRFGGGGRGGGGAAAGGKEKRGLLLEGACMSGARAAGAGKEWRSKMSFFVVWRGCGWVDGGLIQRKGDSDSISDSWRGSFWMLFILAGAVEI
jgi:hypothetical protein